MTEHVREPMLHRPCGRETPHETLMPDASLDPERKRLGLPSDATPEQVADAMENYRPAWLDRIIEPASDGTVVIPIVKESE